jgi:ABC-type transport system involved in multi-copper enzyme maturation permease subunit
MHQWLQRINVIATVGGGFTGLAVSLTTLVSSWSQLKAMAVLIVLGFCVLCAWAIYVGLLISEGATVSRQLTAFYILQIPSFTTPGLSFHAGFGFMLYIGDLPNGNNIQWQLGADWNAGLLSGDGWSFAINLFPILLLWLLRRSNKSLERTRER